MSDRPGGALPSTHPGGSASPMPASGGDALVDMFDNALAKLERTSHFAKASASAPVLDIALRLLARAGGAEEVYARAERLEAAGVFVGSDWSRPELLQPLAASNALDGEHPATASLEMLSEARILAVALGDFLHPTMPSEQAQHYLAQILALKLDRIFLPPNEAERALGSRGLASRNLLAFIADRIGYGHVFDRLIQEIERILAQRPIVVDDIKEMVTRIAVCLADPDVDVGTASRGADRLVSALYGPTPACRDDPGLDAYAVRIGILDEAGLMQEARAFARAMHDTGLVSPYHAVFLQRACSERQDLLEAALGLTSIGREMMLAHADLVARLVERAVTPPTAQSIYGLAMMLQRGVLAHPAVPPALYGQLSLPLCETARSAIAPSGCPDGAEAATALVAGIVNVLGQPLGIGQGNNPTCQSARAISMWAMIAPDYLIHLVERAARDGDLTMRFEGHDISSMHLSAGLAALPPIDVDPVSRLLVPHLDRIYMEMGRLCEGRDGDPHAWVNREMHGWWVGRDTALAVDLATGKLSGHEDFIGLFYGLYDPRYNGDRPVIHPQPVGIAVTDSHARFIGWHAISILRVAGAPDGTMRVYFFNPNNDGGQDWGNGVVVSTEGHGEHFGESSLPIAQFASRLYLFHYDPGDMIDAAAPDPTAVHDAAAMATASWASDR